jgi:hypothetical protein
VCKGTENRASGLVPSGFPIKSLHAFLFSPTPVTFAAHLLFHDLIGRLMNKTLTFLAMELFF